MAMFQRRHYEAIVKVLQDTQQDCRPWDTDGTAVDVLSIAALHLANTFQADNSKFDRAKFLQAAIK